MAAIEVWVMVDHKKRERMELPAGCTVARFLSLLTDGADNTDDYEVTDDDGYALTLDSVLENTDHIDVITPDFGGAA